MIPSILVFLMLPLLGIVFAVIAVVRLILSCNPYSTQCMASLSITSISFGVVLIIDSEPKRELVVIFFCAFPLGLIALIWSCLASMNWRNKPSRAENLVRFGSFGIAFMTLVGGVVGYYLGRCYPQFFLPKIPQHELYIYDDIAMRKGTTMGQSLGALVALIGVITMTVLNLLYGIQKEEVDDEQ